MSAQPGRPVDQIRVGVIGANPSRGWAAEAHLPALAALKGVELCAVATTRRASATESARRWGASHAFVDARELIEHPDVDLVTVALQLPHRGDLVAAVLAAGKHVYCEWPLALDAAEAARLADLAQRARVSHAVGLQGRHSPMVRFFRDLVAGGRVGEVLSATLTYDVPSSLSLPRQLVPLADTWRGVWPGVNHLTVIGGHALDIFRYSVGEFRELSATLATRSPAIIVEETGEELSVTSPDHILIHGILSGGVAASVRILIGGPVGHGLRIDVRGREGRLRLTSDSPSIVGAELTVTLERGNGQVTRIPLPASYPVLLPNADPAIRNVASVYSGLAAAIRAGKPAEPDFGAAVALHRLLDSIVTAADTGVRSTTI
jgi:predicted dehydrogenase